MGVRENGIWLAFTYMFLHIFKVRVEKVRTESSFSGASTRYEILMMILFRAPREDSENI